MQVTRKELESALVSDPFNHELRLEYATLLATEHNGQYSIAADTIVDDQIVKPSFAIAK